MHLSDVGTTGGSGAFLVGVSPLWGFVLADLAAAGVMELFGIRRTRGRDVATGAFLVGALGVAVLLLNLDTTFKNTTGVTQTILFEALFGISHSPVAIIGVLSVLALGIVAALYRPLFLSALNGEMATARGVAVRSTGLLYLAAMALPVALSCMTIGVILSTALLIGPGAAALRLTKSPGRAVLYAALLALVATWMRSFSPTTATSGLP
jgi:zinc/manganese transport system permease protein